MAEINFWAIYFLFLRMEECVLDFSFRVRISHSRAH